MQKKSCTGNRRAKKTNWKQMDSLQNEHQRPNYKKLTQEAKLETQQNANKTKAPGREGANKNNYKE